MFWKYVSQEGAHIFTDKVLSSKALVTVVGYVINARGCTYCNSKVQINLTSWKGI